MTRPRAADLRRRVWPGGLRGAVTEIKVVASVGSFAHGDIGLKERDVRGRRRRFLAVLAGIVTVAGIVTATPAAGAPGADAAGAANRIAGANRYETSALIADRFGAAGTVVIANGEDLKQGADALAANYLAGRAHAPILLTSSDSVSSAVLAAITATLKGAAKPVIYVMGGKDSVSDAVIGRIKGTIAASIAAPVTVRRVAGADRYATSALAATAAGDVSNRMTFAATGAALKTAILVSGQVNADALAAGPLAYRWGIPILLTGSGSLPDSVRAVIREQGITQLLVLGGPDRVSQGVLSQAKAAGVTSVKRLAGKDRFDTAAQLYAFLMDVAQDPAGEHFGADVSSGLTVYLANGLTGFSDALSAGPLAGGDGSVLLTVPADSVPAAAAAFLGKHQGAFDSVVALGAPASVSDGILDAARAASHARGPSPSGDVAQGGSGAGGGVAAGGSDGSTRVPTVTGVSPSTGFVMGGETVTITGLNFTGVAEVLFGAEAGTSVVVASDSELTVVTPTENTGTVSVVLKTATRESATSAASRYTFTQPPDRSQATYRPSAHAETSLLSDVINVTGGDVSGEDHTLHQNGYVVTLSSLATPPTIGAPYFIPPGAAAFPSGLAGVVVGITTGPDGEYIVEIGPASLGDVFDDMKIEYSGPIGDETDGGEPQGLRSRSSHAFASSSGDIDYEGPVGHNDFVDFGKVNAGAFECTGGESIEGSVHIRLENVKTYFVVEAGDLFNRPYMYDWIQYELVPDFDVSVSGKSECKLKASWQNANKKILPVGATGLTDSFAPSLEFSVSAGGTLELSKRFYRKSGYQTDKNGDIKKVNAQSEDPASVKVSGKITIDATVGLEVQFGLLDRIGVGISLGIGGQAEAEFGALPVQEICVSLQFYLQESLYAYLDVWFKKWETKLISIKRTISDLSHCFPLLEAPPPTQPPTIITRYLPDGEVGQVYNAELTTQDHRVGTWAVTSGTLPEGITLSGYILSGTPVASGVSQFTVAFTDEYRRTVSVPVNINVGGGSDDGSGGDNGSGEPDWNGTWTVESFPLPEDAAVDELPRVNSFSCTADMLCVGIGDYLAADATDREAVLWSRPRTYRWEITPAPLPDGIGPVTSVSVIGSSCAAEGVCFAFGHYSDEYYQPHELIWTTTDGTWSVAAPPLPTDAAADAEVEDFSVISCEATTSCFASGTYRGADGTDLMGIWTFGNGAWEATALAAPSGVSDPGGFLDESGHRTACSADRERCVTTASYGSSAGGATGLLTLADGTWSFTQLDLPGDAKPSANLNIAAISCGSAYCVADGWYGGTDNKRHDAIWKLADGIWTDTDIQPPAGGSFEYGAGGEGELSCGTGDSCVMRGTYEDEYSVSHSILWILSGNLWSPLALPSPGEAEPPETYEIDGMSCAGNHAVCAAFGSYESGDSRMRSSLWALVDDEWVATDMADFSNDYDWSITTSSSIACGSDGACAVGLADLGFESEPGWAATWIYADGAWHVDDLPLLPDADGYTIELQSVSCTQYSSTCVMWGKYSTSSGFRPALWRYQGGRWDVARPPAPLDADPSTTASVDQAWSWSSGAANAVGRYQPEAGSGTSNIVLWSAPALL